MKQLFLVQTRRSNIWSEQTNTKQSWKRCNCHKKVKVSCEAVSIVKVSSLNNCSNNLIYRKTWSRWWSYLSKFLTSFYGISYHFSEIFTEAALGRNICKCLYWSLRKKWWSDESVRPSMLLKLESATDVFIDKVHKF